MTKHYCDRCVCETKTPNECRIPFEYISDYNIRCKDVQLCDRCKNDLRKIEKNVLPQIAKLRISIYENFMDYSSTGQFE
jgi:hypothetical protein